MSEEIKKEMTDEELDNVAGAGLLQELYELIKSDKVREKQLIRVTQQGGKNALMPELIKLCNDTGNQHLTWLVNDVLGLLDYDWRKMGYFEDNMFRKPKNFL